MKDSIQHIRVTLLLATLGGASVAPTGPVLAAAGCPGTIAFDNGAGTGVWQTAQNWSTDQLPGPSDDACIPAGMSVILGSGAQSIGTLFVEAGGSLAISGGSLSVAAASQVDGGFSLSGGALAGAGEVTIDAPFTWAGGGMTGTGTTHANGGIAFSGAAVKDVTGGRVLSTAGTTTWAGGALRLGSGASIRNAGIWDVQGDTLMDFLGGSVLFDNLAGATFRKSAGTGTLSIEASFTNAGALTVLRGTVSLTVGGSGTGTFTASPGAALAFSGGTYALLNGSSLDAPAVFVGNAATLDISGTYAVSTTTTVSGTGVPGFVRFNPAATVISLGTAVSLDNGILDLSSGEPIGLTTLSLTASGSSLRGTDTVTVSDPIAWTGGNMTGTGTTNASAGIAFSGTGVKDVTGGRVLNTAGTTLWAVGTVRLGSGASIRNAGIWDVQGDLLIDFLGGAVLFSNQAGATFRKSAGTGTMTIEAPFANAGALSVLTGTVNLFVGGSGTGTFTASPGAALAFSGGTYALLNGSSLDAPAVLVGNAATLDVSGTYAVSTTTTVSGTGVPGLARFNPAATVTSLGTVVTLDNGILDLNCGEPIALTTLSLTASGSSLRGTDTVTVTDPIAWTAGDMSGTGTTNANAGIAFSGAGVKDISGGRVLNTAGTTTWTGGSVRLGSGAVIRNSGVWEIQGDIPMVFLGSAAPLFVNQSAGIFRKSAGTGTMGINVAFNNAGALSILSGTVSLTAGGSGNGTFTASPGAALAFNGGTYALLSGSSLDAPTVTVGNGSTLDVSGTYTVSTTTTVSGTAVSAFARFNPAATVNSLGSGVTLGNGILDLSSGEPIGLTTLSLTATGSSLRGTDAVTVSGPITWTAGNMMGTGTTNASGGILFSGTGVKDITGGRVINTAGTTTWTGGPIRPGSGASIRNAGIWDIQGDTSMVLLPGALPQFDNEATGTFRKSAGTGTATIDVPFANAGNVRGLAGTLSFSDGYTQSAGSTAVDGGVISSPTPLAIQGGSVGGSGVVAAAVANAGRLAPGLSPGALTISGTCSQAASGSFDVEIGGLAPGTGHDRADVSGAAGLAGTLNVSLVNAFSPADFDTFTVMTFPSSSGAFDAASFPALGGDLVWKLHHNPTSIVLEVLADLDGDGVRNATDCAPDDPTAWSVPAEVPGAGFAPGGQSLEWESLAPQAGPSIAYDVMRGLTSELPAGGGASETCLGSGGTADNLMDGSSPASGTAFYYLVRGTNICGVGTYGAASSGEPRLTDACP